MRTFFILISACLVAALGAPTAEVERNDISDAINLYERNDIDLAFRSLRTLAEQGDIDAQVMMGAMYAKGRGVVQNHANAAIWWRLAGEQGNVMAQYFLGGLYRHGRGVSQDFAKAAKWLRLAAEKGLSEAQQNLGVMYIEGHGVRQDYIRAHKWLLLAAAQGNKSAEFNMKLLVGSMTATEIALARQQARQWILERHR
ncbi:MAG: tetratricopeptide repeat protein [Rhodospirillales bacterium]|jgi:hypothetical protein|nr:tetratricopeptide repeat protein [Rhodospirillales bacterium]MDP7215138.1 tetratricopeptide repeat protein [Rhodospirillales bacterium]HIJ92106.1 sel1 repeat family protein [Rhodospirillaceae bacterium]HJP54077.1 tetratricopeptide repeat protein [Rhodospirillales bacterium]